MPVPEMFWITPPFVSRRLPLERVNPKLDVLPKVMPPMLRLASTVTVRAAVSVLEKVAMSVLFRIEVEPGTPAVQLPAVLQLPAASTFHEESAACVVRAPAMHATAHRSVNTPFGRER